MGKKLLAQRLDVIEMPPGEFGRFYRDEIAKWTNVAQAVGVETK